MVLLLLFTIINWFSLIWYRHQLPTVEQSNSFLLLHHSAQIQKCDPCHLWSPSCAEGPAFSTGEARSPPSRSPTLPLHLLGAAPWPLPPAPCLLLCNRTEQKSSITTEIPLFSNHVSFSCLRYSKALLKLILRKNIRAAGKIILIVTLCLVKHSAFSRS